MQEELRTSLETTCGLVFDDETMQELFDLLDPDGSGSMDFNEFCAAVMDVSKVALKSGTSLNTSGAALTTIDDKNCNSMQFLRRKVRENWKALSVSFGHHVKLKGSLDAAALRDILYRFDIVPAESQLQELCAEMDKDGDGTIDHKEFLAYWAPGTAEDLNVTGGAVRVGKEKAKVMIRDAIESRLSSGPGGLRKAFKVHHPSPPSRSFCASSLDWVVFRCSIETHLAALASLSSATCSR